MTVKQQATREAIEYVLKRGVVQIEKEADLRHLINGGEPLHVKLGKEALCHTQALV